MFLITVFYVDPNNSADQQTAARSISFAPFAIKLIKSTSLLTVLPTYANGKEIENKDFDYICYTHKKIVFCIIFMHRLYIAILLSSV